MQLVTDTRGARGRVAVFIAAALTVGANLALIYWVTPSYAGLPATFYSTLSEGGKTGLAIWGIIWLAISAAATAIAARVVSTGPFPRQEAFAVLGRAIGAVLVTAGVIQIAALLAVIPLDLALEQVVPLENLPHRLLTVWALVPLGAALVVTGLVLGVAMSLIARQSAPRD